MRQSDSHSKKSFWLLKEEWMGCGAGVEAERAIERLFCNSPGRR